MKRTIGKTFKDSPELGGFCGWRKVENVLDSLSGEALQIFVGLFSFGCRASELCKVQAQQVHLDYRPDQIEIRNAYVSKWRKVVGSRTFHINKSEAIYPFLEKCVEYTDDTDPVFPFSYNQIYYRVAGIEAPEFLKPTGSTRTDWTHYKGPWWPHRIRAERACQLIKDYNFSTYALKKWFGWRTSVMPSFYGDMTAEDVAALMRRPQLTLEVTPQMLSNLDPERRDFILELLNER